MATSLFYSPQANSLNDILARHTLIIIADANSNGFCVPVAKKVLPALQMAQMLVIPAGEGNKTLQMAEYIYSQLLAMQATKNTLIVNIGGGVLCDVAAFAASTFKRGLPFVNIPTTLLSMVDAAHGGKNGVNFGGIKNVIGTFTLPQAVYIHPPFLETLPQRQLANGAAESVKHALIHSAQLWNVFVQAQNLDIFTQINSIEASITTKLHFTNADPLDMGTRQALNFGHTIGHAIEAASAEMDKVPLLHGESILLGMLAELELSEQLLGCPTSIKQQLQAIKNKFYAAATCKIPAKILLQKIISDKKNDDHLRFSLLKNVGEPAIKTIVSIENLQEILNKINLL